MRFDKKGVLGALCAITVFAVQAEVDFSGVRRLAGRLGGEALTGRLSFEEWTGQDAEKAQIVPDGASFKIKATSVHAASLALGVYLRDVAKGHVSWCGKRLPTEWTLPTSTIDVAARYPYAMAYNYCTLSYTMAYWSQEAWQAEIDRLALSGYSTALVMAGVQKIWKLTLEDMGYTTTQRENFITDDAVQAWWLMGNLQAQGDGTESGRYPIVSEAEIEKDAEIGAWLVGALREVGIEPVLQGFIGLVPSSTTVEQIAAKLGYDASDATKINIFRNGYYNEGQKNPDLIDPTCAAFEEFSNVWNKNLKAVYGLSAEAGNLPKYLGGDLFHESSPPSSMTYEQKVNCARFVQQYQQNAFPGVTWVLQNWQSAPVQELRNGLDPAHTIIQRLDQSMNATDSRASSYMNNTTGEAIPWVWVEVMNFGGNTGMHGAFTRFRNVGNLGGNASFRGYGLLSEGLETNPISYEMYNSRFTETTADAQNITDAELEPWMEAYRLRRYGHTDDELKAAYSICARTVWNCTLNQQGTVESVFCAKPGYAVTKVSAWGPTTGTPYDRLELVEAARHVLAAAKATPALLDLETFRYDFVEIFQQILADKARELLPDCANSKKRRTEFRQMLDLVDRMLACSDEWRLDRKEARTLGKAPTTGPAAYRRMITTWTPGARGQTQLSQYAHRSYAGLMKHYYAKKWNAFFDVTEGTMTQAAYNTLCANLDRDFPTTELPATPTDGDPIALAEEILDYLTPQALTWSGVADSSFEGANWQDAKKDTVAWEDGKDAVLAGNGLTITAGTPVQVGGLSFENTTIASPLNGYLDNTTAQTVFTGVTVETLHQSDLVATMGGSGWFGIKEGNVVVAYRSAEARGYFKSAISGTGDGRFFTANFQCLDDGWVKAVTVKFIQSGDDVMALTTSTGAKSGATVGSAELTTGTTAPPTSEGYGIKEFAYFGPSTVTLAGPITVAGPIVVEAAELTTDNAATIGCDLELNGGRVTYTGAEPVTVGLVTVGEKGGTLVLPSAGSVSLDAIQLLGDRKLVLVGTAPTLLGAAAEPKVSVPRASLAKVVYVGPDGVEQLLKLDASGFLKSQLEAMTYDGFITATATKTNWKHVTLDDLAACEYTAAMTGGWTEQKDFAVRGYLIARNENSVTLQLQGKDTASNMGTDAYYVKSMPITLTIGDDGYVYVQGATCGAALNGQLGVSVTGSTSIATSATGAGYGVHNLVVTPAVAQVSGIVANYAELPAAIEAADGTETVTLLADVTSPSSMITTKTRLVIPQGVTLTAGCGDFIKWNTAFELDVAGTLDLGAYQLSYSEGNGQTVSVHAGGKIQSSSAKGLSVFGASTVYAKVGAAGSAAQLDLPLQARQNITLDVDADVTVIGQGNLVLKQAGDSGIDRPTVTKTGAGTYDFRGMVQDGVTLVLADGILARTMSLGDTLTVTVTGGSTAITAENRDHKIVETVDGSVHVFTCVAKDYRFYVTDPGEISVNMPGTAYETLEEALASARALKEANPGEIVKLWILSQEVFDAAKAELEAYNAAKGTDYTYFGDGNGIEIRGWDESDDPGPDEPETRVLSWNVAKTYWESESGTDANGNHGKALLNGEEVVITSDDIVTFDSTFDAKTLYINKDLRNLHIRVLAGATLHIGKADLVSTVPDGFTIEIEKGASVVFTAWSKGTAVIGDVSFSGEGEISFDTAKVTGLVFKGAVSGPSVTLPDLAAPILADRAQTIGGETVEPLLVERDAEGQVTVSLVVANPVEGLVYELEESSDLSDWAVPADAVSVTASGSAPMQLVARPTTAVRRFYRVRARTR